MDNVPFRTLEFFLFCTQQLYEGASVEFSLFFSNILVTKRDRAVKFMIIKLYGNDRSLAWYISFFRHYSLSVIM